MGSGQWVVTEKSLPTTHRPLPTKHMSLTDKAEDRAKKNPRLLFAILVILHLIVISLNRVPGQPDIRYLQKMMMTGATPLQWLTSHGVTSVKSVWTGYFDLRGAKSENETLKTRVSQL